jgi:hypothetical protein
MEAASLCEEQQRRDQGEVVTIGTGYHELMFARRKIGEDSLGLWTSQLSDTSCPIHLCKEWIALLPLEGPSRRAKIMVVAPRKTWEVSLLPGRRFLVPKPPTHSMFIVKLTTHQGPVTEQYEDYAEARRRVEQFPADSLVGLAYIFQQLPDGSERVVRDDGKPLQFHRCLVEGSADCSDEPIPLLEDASGLLGPDGKLRFEELKPPGDDWDDLPLA